LHQPQGNITLGSFVGRKDEGPCRFGLTHDNEFPRLFPSTNLAVTVNPGNEALASEYESTRDSGKVLRVMFFSCRARCFAQDGAAEVVRWRGWCEKRKGRRGRRRLFRRNALGRGARTKSGLRGQGKGPVAGERGVGVGRRLAGRRRVWRRRA
jgi:hypothetical protein